MNKKTPLVASDLPVVNQGNSRPSLYTTTASSDASDRKISILGSMDSDRSSRRMRWRWLMLTSILLLFLGFIYWTNAIALFTGPMSIPSWMEASLNLSKPSKPIIATSNQPAEIKFERLTETSAIESHPALILNEPVPLDKLDPIPAKLDSAEKQVMQDTDQTNKKNRVEQQPSAINVGSVEERKISNQKSELNAVATEKHAISSVESKHVKKFIATKRVKTEDSNNDKDGDVDLIAALLSRISGQSAVNNERNGKTVTVSAKPAPISIASKRQNQMDTNRDIVARTSDDTTADLIKRCKTLGFIEGELCRIRICSNRWGSDSSCAAPEQSSPSNLSY